MVSKVEGESIATRRSLEELKEERRSRYEETKKHVNVLETKVKNMKKKLGEFSMQVFTTVQNTCMSLLDPLGAQSTHIDRNKSKPCLNEDRISLKLFNE